MSETSDKGAYEHRSDIPGRQNEPGASTEHRDTADAPVNDTNELSPGGREPEEERGPRTHDSLRTTRKD